MAAHAHPDARAERAAPSALEALLAAERRNARLLAEAEARAQEIGRRAAAELDQLTHEEEARLDRDLAEARRRHGTELAAAAAEQEARASRHVSRLHALDEATLDRLAARVVPWLPGGEAP